VIKIFEVQEYLKPYIGKIVVCHAEEDNFPRWKHERESYLYDGDLRGKNMREILPNEILIEFDRRPGINVRDSRIRNEAVYWITQIKDKLESHRKFFYVTDHSGKSPHLRTLIDGLDKYNPEQRAEYKKMFVMDLLHDINFSPELITLDHSFFTDKPMIIPLENAIHWKKKYNTREIIIYINNHPHMRVQKEKMSDVLNLILKRTSFIPPSGQPLTTSSLSYGLDIDRLEEVFKKYYSEGRRHYIITGWTIMMCKRGFGLDQIKRFFNKISSNLNTQEGTKDYQDIKFAYDDCMSSNLSEKSPKGMFGIACEKDPDLTRTCCIDFTTCFNKEVDI
jgi:hypothetical protein